MTLDLDATLLVEENGAPRPLRVADLIDAASAREATLATRASEATLAAVEAALAQVGTELGQKVEPGDLSALAHTVDAQAIRDRLPAAGAASETTLAAVRVAVEDLAADDDGIARDATTAAVRDRIGDPAGPAAGTLLARLEAVRALLAGSLTVDTELAAAGPLATEATLGALATELGQKVEPADLAPLATAARQDAAKGTLDAIAGALAGGPFATAAGQGDLLAAVARDATLQALRDRVGDPAGPAAGTLLARLEQLRALLAGTLTVDTELTAVGPLATQATLASVLTALQGTLTVDTELSAAGPLATQATLAAIAAQLPAALVGGRLDVNLGAAGATVAVDSELPTAVALASGTARPTAPAVGAFNFIDNGTTADLAVSADAKVPSASGLTRTGVQLVASLIGDSNTQGLRWLLTAAQMADAVAGNNFGGTGLYGYTGGAWDRARIPNVFKTRADASITAGTPAAGWTPTSGKKFRLMAGQLSLSVAGQIILKDGATEILRSPQLAAGATWNIDNLGNGKLSSAANNVLNIDVSGTGNVGGWLGGTEE